MAVRKQIPMNDASTLVGARSGTMPSLVRRVNEEGHTDGAVMKADVPAEEDVDLDLREVYFLIMHFLSGGPCHRTCGQLWNELLEHKLLPRRYHAWYSRTGKKSGDEDDDGLSFPLSYAQLVERYPHIEKNHLVKLLQQLLLKSSSGPSGLSDAKNVTGADVPTLLGSGSFSLLEFERAKGSNPTHKGDNYHRWPHSQANQVHALSLREIGGGFAKHHRAPSVRAACYAIAKPSTLLEKIQIIKKLRGHQNAVYCAIFDRSGQHVITGSDDRLVKVWSMETGFCLASCRGHEGDITDLAVSLDNVLVASASNDSMIRVWRLPDGLPISVFRHTGVVTAIAFSPRPGCSHHLLSSCDDGICRLWDARDSNVKPRVYVPKPIENTSGVKTNGLKGNDPSQFASQREKRILCCAFNASGTFFVTGSSDTMARVWSACKWSEEGGNQVNHELDILTGHEHDVNYVQFSGTAVPARSFSADSAKEEKLSKFKNTWFTHDNIVTCSPDGSAIIWVPRSRRNHSRVGRWIRAYHLRVPPPPMPPQQPRGGPRQRNVPTPRGVNMIVWSLDNRFVLAAIMDCRICVWNAVDGSLVHSLTGHTELTYVLDVHPFNPRIAMSAGYDGKTIIWDIWEGVPIRIYETGQFRLVDGKFSPDGTSIVLSDEVGQIYILGTGQGESQKDAKYDQFFLGDYRPLIQDVHGNVLDQETQLPPYRRNMQDLLCDSSIMPYPEPYQSMFQQRRLGALGIDWQPPSVRLAIGTNDDGFFAIPDDLLGQLPPAPIPGNRDRWLEQPAELEDAMDWEQENDAQSDDTGSEYNVTDECTSEGEQGSLNASSSEESECSVDEYENAKHEGVSRAHLRRSKRKKRRSEPISTSCGRFVKKKNVETGDGSRSRIKKYKYSRNGTSALKERSSEKTSRPQRRAAQNALTLFSRIGDGFTEEEDFNEGDSGSQGSGYSQPEESPLSSESERSIRTGKQKCYALEDRSQDDLMPATKPFQHVGTNEEEEANRHEDSNKHAILRKKIVLKLPSRDSRRLILPESTRSDSDIQGNADSPSVQIPLKEEKQLRGCVTSLDVTEAKLAHEPYFESSNTASSPQSAWRVDHGNGINKGLGRSETAPEQPCDLSLGYEGKEIRWGEVKTRTSKRLRVGDFNTADLCKSKVVNSIAVDAQQHLEIMQSSCNPEDGIKEQSIGNGFFLQGQVEHQSELMHMKPQKFFIGSSSGALHVAECGDITPERRTNSLAGYKEVFPENQPMMNANMCPTGNGSAMEADWRTDERYMSDKFERSILKDLSNDNLNEYPEMAETVADNGENVNLNNGGKSSYEAAEIKHSDFAKLRSRCRKTKKGFHDMSVEQKHNPSEEWEDFGNKQTIESIRPIEDMSERLMWRGSGARTRGHWGQQFEGKNEAHNFEYDNDEHIEDIGLNAAVDGDMQNAGQERKWASGVNVHAELENSMGMVQNTSNEDKNHVRLFDGGRKTRSKRIKQAKETFQETESSSKHYMIDNGYNCEGKRTRIQMEGIDARESFVGAEWTSTSRVLSAVRPARNKKSTILANTRMPVEKKKGRQLTRKQCWLMLSEAEEGNRYIPQFRDEVAYLRQGHEEFLEMRRSYEKGPWQEKGPWKTIKGNIQAVEFCQVVELEYNPVAGSGDTCCKLTLKFSDPVSNVFGKNFKLTLPELTNFPDFLVEKSRYDAAISRNWTHRDKCEVWWRAENGEGGSWYSGRVIGVKPKSSEFPDSPWDRYYVQYKNDSSGPHPHSPWELFDLGHHSLDLPRIDSEINIQLQYSISELEEISNENEDYYGLGKLSQVSEKSEFHNRIPLPLSLDIIKRRLDNYYYRSVEAFQHDLRILVANAKFYFCKDPRMLSKLQRLSERISQGF